MTAKKQTKTAVKKVVKNDNPLSLTSKEKKTLDNFFESLKKHVIDIAKDLNLATKEPHNYYVSYVYKDKDGQLAYDGASICTNLNVYDRKGYGIKMLSDKFKIEHGIEGDLTILNVIEMED